MILLPPDHQKRRDHRYKLWFLNGVLTFEAKRISVAVGELDKSCFGEGKGKEQLRQSLVLYSCWACRGRASTAHVFECWGVRSPFISEVNITITCQLKPWREWLLSGGPKRSQVIKAYRPESTHHQDRYKTCAFVNRMGRPYSQKNKGSKESPVTSRKLKARECQEGRVASWEPQQNHQEARWLGTVAYVPSHLLSVSMFFNAIVTFEKAVSLTGGTDTKERAGG